MGDPSEPTAPATLTLPPLMTTPLPIAPGPREIPMWGEIRLRHDTGSKRWAYNPRRHLQPDDYEPQHLRSSRSPSPAGGLITSPRRRNPSATRTASTSHPTVLPSVRPIKVTGVIFEGLRLLAVDSVRDPPGGHYFNCWQHGHSRRACPRSPRRGYCINWESRGNVAQGAGERQSRGRPHIDEGSQREIPQATTPARRHRPAEREEARAQEMPPPPVAPTTNPGTTHYLAQILRDTRDVEPEVRHQILRVVLGEEAAAGPRTCPTPDRPQ